MRDAGRRSSVTSARVVGCAAALFVVFGSAQVAAQNPKDMTPELEKVRQAHPGQQLGPEVLLHAIALVVRIAESSCTRIARSL